LFTYGAICYAFTPLEWVSSRGKEIHEAQKKKVAEHADEYPPAIRAQYDIMLERFDRLSPGIEIFTYPGFASYPSMFIQACMSARCSKPTFIIFSDPPEEGRKYFTIQGGMNHQWSRGTIVRAHFFALPVLYLIRVDVL